MGNDGGSIPHREDMIREKPKEKKVDQALHAHTKSRLCSLSSQNLTLPLVADRIGNIFTKEAILGGLVNKNISKAYCYIRKMKDVKDLNPVMKNPESNRIDNEGNNLIVCPISGTEFDGFHKFTLLWACGCVIATKVFENMDLNGSCPNCGQKFKEKDKIDMTKDPKTSEECRKNLVEKAVLKKRQKKAEKEGNKEEIKESTALGKRTRNLEETKNTHKNQKTNEVEKILEQESNEEWTKKSKINDQSYKYKNDVEERLKQKLEKDDTFKSLFNNGTNENKETDFLCRSGYGMR